MNKKIIIIILIVIVAIGIGLGIFFNNEMKEENVNSNTTAIEGETTMNNENETNNTVNEKRTVKTTLREGESIQTDNKDRATRVVSSGTKIKMTFGDTIIYGLLNDSETAQALIKKLEEGPVIQHESRYSHDFCGVTEDLPYNEEEVHYGWLNGDIDYSIDAPYFTILFKDEEISEQYGYLINIGVITSNISEIDSLTGSYDIKIELDR